MTTQDPPVWTRPEPESPCVRVCLIDPQSGLCLGCRRTRDEIAAWPRMSAADRRALLARLATRPVPPRRRRGGRAGRSTRAEGAKGAADG